MHKRLRPLPGYGVTWSVNRRIAIVAGAVAVLLAVTAAVAWSTSRGQPHPPRRVPVQSGSAVPSASVPVPSAVPRTVAAPPQIAEPVAYAKAAAAMLWSYDTRDSSRDEQLAGMHAWLTTESAYADWPSVAAQVPDPVLWSRMADQDQHATAVIAEGHYPDAFQQALADDPSAITEAYIYVVTVNGSQRIAWKHGGAGAEERAVTLAVQCRPGRDCALAAIAPSVSQ